MNHDLRLRVEGAYPERLLQRCLTQGARFARVRRTGARTLILDTDERSAEIVLALCKRYGLNHRVLRHGGLSALLQGLRSRWTLALGLILCAALCWGFLSRIWIIDVAFTGPDAALGSASALRRCIAEQGMKPGMAASAVDAERLQKRLLAEAGDYSFIGVRVQGVRLLVEASPEVPAPEVYEISRARDLVAARDGVVESVTVHSGEASVKAGETVRMGQTLIRGEEDRSKEETNPVAALGEVIARCWYEGSAQAPLEKRIVTPTGRSETECCLALLGFSAPITECEGYASETLDEEILPVVGLFLPLEVVRTTHSEVEERRENVDEAALEATLTALARAELQAKLTAEGLDYELAAAWEDVSRSDGMLRVRAVYEIFTDIAVSRGVLSEEVNETWKTVR